MTRPTILLTDRGWDDADIERQLCDDAGYDLVDVQEPADEDALVRAVTEADPVGILFCWAPVTARVLAAAPRLAVASRLGVGLDNIDLPEAARRNLTVTRVPDYCVEEVSDHVVALVHNWARGVTAFDRDVRDGRWRPGMRDLRRVRDLTVGVWGLGAIGSATAAKFAALGCTVVGHNRSVVDPPAGVEVVSPADLLARSDVVSLHVPAVAGAGPLIGATELAAMRPGSLLVNTSRGALVDTDALVSALRTGTPGAAALDVLPAEPEVPEVLRAAMTGPD
ncbi:MAG TPA: NAD(P)-dependent oxidoreductase, partial [Microthrixaceae bacterium]|nr:NAD(P)-dependent oxidoreductase [Microthrixaceae bacterium]